MDFLDIIGKVIEFSEKGEEYSDEIKTFKATLQSLQLTVQQIGTTEMPDHLRDMLSENLNDSEKLLEKCAKSNSTWLTNFRNMLPGSQLQKIKEKNQQLIHIIQLINLHLNSEKNIKRSLQSAVTKDYDADEPKKLKKLHTLADNTQKENLNMPKKSASDSKFDAIIGPTLADADDGEESLEGPTQADNADEFIGETGEDEVAFRLRVLYDLRLGSVLKDCKDLVPIIEKKWEGQDTSDYTVQRVNFAHLPMEDLKRLSRDHCVITATRKHHKTSVQKEDLNVAATVPDDDKLFGATIADDGEENLNGNGVSSGENEFTLKDLSLNGTYYLKGVNLLNFPSAGMKIQGDFKHLAKNEEVRLQNGDIICLIAQKPHCKELIFGFQLLTE